jgi:hypothetical protein
MTVYPLAKISIKIVLLIFPYIFSEIYGIEDLGGGKKERHLQRRTLKKDLYLGSNNSLYSVPSTVIERIMNLLDIKSIYRLKSVDRQFSRQDTNTPSVWNDRHENISKPFMAQLQAWKKHNIVPRNLSIYCDSDASIYFIHFLKYHKISRQFSKLQSIAFRMHHTIGLNGTKILSEALKENENLTHFNFLVNWIDDNGIKILAPAFTRMELLTFLDPSCNKIGVEGAKDLATALYGKTNLKSLKLGHNEIGDEGIGFISAALQSHISLAVLELWSNGIGDKGAEDLANAFQNHDSLTILDLNYNRIQLNGARILAASLRVNKSLDLFRNSQFELQIINACN